ncbi:hypothetical protein GCM10027059_26860 [Myceligenerans halotolerans]
MNTRPGYAPPNAEVEPFVETPAVGTYVVEDGDVYTAELATNSHAACICTDGRHRTWDRSVGARTLTEAQRFADSREEGHVVSLRSVTVVSEVRA